MSKLEHYALNFDAIEATLADFFSNKEGYEYTFEKDSDLIHKVSIKNDVKSKKPGIIRIYNKRGQYCLEVAGAPSLNTIANDCKKFLIERLRIPYMDAKCFVLRDIDAELFDTYIEYLKSDYDLSDDKGDVAEARHYVLTDVTHSSVSLTFYNSGTLRIQGIFTALFANIIAESSKELASEKDVLVKEFLSLSQMKSDNYSKEISELVNNPTPLLDNNLDIFVTTSTILADSGIELGDYACYSFGILKAIEGLLALKLGSHISKDTDSIGICFEENKVSHKFHLKSTVNDFDGNKNLKNCIENAYNFYNKNRHTTFHTKKIHVETSRILTYEDAKDIIDEGLSIIDDLCNNW